MMMQWAFEFLHLIIIMGSLGVCCFEAQKSARFVAHHRWVTVHHFKSSFEGP